MTGQILERSFASGLIPSGDGRTVEGRCVPYGVIATIHTDRETYQECFDHGAFARVVRAPNRVVFRISHLDNYANTVGYGTELEERDDGLYGQFKLYQADADKAREMIAESYRGLSVGFLPLAGGTVRRGNVLHRILAHLDHVAAVVEGTSAYADAQVLAVRQDGSMTYERVAEELPAPADDEAARVMAELADYNAQMRARIEADRARLAARLTAARGA